MKKPVFIAVFSVAAPVLAADIQPQQLETVVVRAAREPVALSVVGSAVNVLDGQMLERRQLAPLAEILRSVPGVAVSRAGVMGAQTQLRLRGAESNHVLVFIDGVRANDPAQNDEFNMAHVLNSDIESVEVLRGPQSALWGSDALAGVINITTRGAEAGLRANAFAEGGSNSWQNYGAGGAYAHDRWRVRASANKLDTDGENISRRGGEDDGYSNMTTNVGLGYRFGDALAVDSSFRYTDARNEYDGTDFTTGLPADAANRTDADQLYGRIVAHLHAPGGRWSQQLSYAVSASNNKNLSENAFAPTGFDVTRADADVAVFGYQAAVALNDKHRLIGALEYQREDFRQRGPVGFGDPNRDESLDTRSAVLEYRGAPTESLSVSAAVRRDDNSDFKDKTTGRMSVAWLLFDGQTKWRASYGSGIKNPTFTERFGYFNDFIGNPGLQPEQSIGWDVGVDQRLMGDRLNVSLTWFQAQLKDEIDGFVFDPVSGGFTARNGDGKSDRRGMEFSSAWQLAPSVSLTLAYTWTDATQDAAGSGGNTREIRRPRHIASANLNGTFFDERANVNLNVDYNGKQDDFAFPPYPPYQQRVQLDGFTLVTLAASYRLSPRLQVYARLENALDEHYEEVFGYASQGRTAYAGARYTFSD